jgi:hypothetical protein
MQNTFSVTGAGTAEVFRCQSGEDFSSWFDAIDEVINALRSKRIDTRGANVVQNGSVLPASKNLNSRALSAHKFLSSEMRLSDQVTTMIQVLIKPMIGASNGSVLSVGADKGKEELTSTKAQASAISEALQTPDVKAFLRAAEALSNGLKDFVTKFRAACDDAQWSEDILIGQVFNSESSRALFNCFKAYAAGQQGCLRILKGKMFSDFYREAENSLSGYPGNLADKLENPRNRPAQYLEFLNQLLQFTPSNHPDNQPLVAAIKTMNALSTEVEGTVKSKRNYEKLLEIQSFLVVTTNLLYAVDGKFVQKLNSPDRKFIKEGDLKKVCRKKNKTFRFWLFNDYLCYGSALGNSTYSFHRALDLKTCAASLLNNPKNAFQLKAAEKSFIVIAPHENAQNEWVNKIVEARAALGVHEETSMSLAPVWETDHSGQGCCVCNQVSKLIVIITISNSSKIIYSYLYF